MADSPTRELETLLVKIMADATQYLSASKAVEQNLLAMIVKFKNQTNISGELSEALSALAVTLQYLDKGMNINAASMTKMAEAATHMKNAMNASAVAAANLQKITSSALPRSIPVPGTVSAFPNIASILSGTSKTTMAQLMAQLTAPDRTSYLPMLSRPAVGLPGMNIAALVRSSQEVAQQRLLYGLASAFGGSAGSMASNRFSTGMDMAALARSALPVFPRGSLPVSRISSVAWMQEYMSSLTGAGRSMILPRSLPVARMSDENWMREYMSQFTPVTRGTFATTRGLPQVGSPGHAFMMSQMAGGGPMGPTPPINFAGLGMGGGFGDRFRAGALESLATLRYYAIRTGILAVVGALVASVKAFADYDDALTRTVATMGAAAPQMRGQMDTVIKGIASRSITSPTELAHGFQLLSQAGFSAAEAMRYLSTVNSFAVAGAMDMKEAVGTLTTIMHNFHMEGKDLAHISDVIIKGAMLGGRGTTEQFAEAMVQASTAAHVLGFSVEETAAAIATFARHGLVGHSAATQLTRLMNQLGNAASRHEGVWHLYNVSMFNSNGQMKTLAETIEMLQTRMAGFSTRQKESFLLSLGLGGTDRASFRGLFALLDDGSAAFKKLVDDIKASEGATKKFEALMMSAFGMELKLVWNNIKIFAIELGEFLAPTIRVVTILLVVLLRIIQAIPKPFKDIMAWIVPLRLAFWGLGIAGLGFVQVGTAVRISVLWMAGAFTYLDASIARSLIALGAFVLIAYAVGRMLRADNGLSSLGFGGEGEPREANFGERLLSGAAGGYLGFLAGRALLGARFGGPVGILLGVAEGLAQQRPANVGEGNTAYGNWARYMAGSQSNPSSMTLFLERNLPNLMDLFGLFGRIQSGAVATRTATPLSTVLSAIVSSGIGSMPIGGSAQEISLERFAISGPGGLSEQTVGEEGGLVSDRATHTHLRDILERTPRHITGH